MPIGHWTFQPNPPTLTFNDAQPYARITPRGTGWHLEFEMHAHDVWEVGKHKAKYFPAGIYERLADAMRDGVAYADDEFGYIVPWDDE